jgi:soluble lytic murein transglycosylase-like protein
MKLVICGLLAIAPIAPVLADQDASDIAPETQPERPVDPSATAQGGYRISNAGDFALVEHGYWSPPINPSPAETPATFSLDAGPTLPDFRHPLKMMKTNFRREAFLPHVYAAELRFALPSGLLDALIWTESRYNPIAVSKVGAAGLGQLMPGTAKDLGVSNRFDPYANILGAARYLRQMFDQFGVVHLALAAYNAGPGAVKKRRAIPLNGETPGYVSSVLKRWVRN